MAGRRKQAGGHYDPAKLVDAREHHQLSRAMGILTWSTWDGGSRPVEERIAEFVACFPPADPVCHMGDELMRAPEGVYGKAGRDRVLGRFLETDGRAGSLHELLARYGLKIAGGPRLPARPFEPGVFRDVTRQRNHKLRVLHGGVDVEPENMDAAKAEYLDRQEKQQAALDVRTARKRMKDELARGKSGRDTKA